MGLLESLVLGLALACVAVLGWCAKKISDHDATDRELAAKVDSFNQRMGRLESRLDRWEMKMDEGFAALGNKIDLFLLHNTSV